MKPSRKGFGEAVIVAVILVVFISLTTSALLMIYMMNEMSKVKEQHPEKEIGSVVIEAVEEATSTELKLVVRNVGSNVIVIDSAYLYDSQHRFVGIMYPIFGDVTIEPKESREIVFSPNEPIRNNYTYVEIRGRGFSIASINIP
jgi:hypothetical protein